MKSPALALILLFLAPSTRTFAKEVRVAVVADGPSDAFRRTTVDLKAQVDALFQEDRTDVAFPSAPTHTGSFTQQSVDTKFAEALADPAYDLVIGLGFLTGRAAAQTDAFNKPTLLPFAVPRLQGLPREGRASGKKNLAYVTGLLDLERDLRRFREVIRRDRVAMVVDGYVLEALDTKLTPERERAERGGMKVTLVQAATSAKSVLDALPADTEAVYIAVLARMPNAEVGPLLEGLTDRNLPTYVAAGRPWVERGAFATLVPPDDLVRRFRRIALYVQDAISGGKPERFDTTFAQTAQLVLNMGTAKRIGVSPRFELMTEAELIGGQSVDRGPQFTLTTAIERATKTNLDFEVSRRDLGVAQAGLRESRGNLLPAIDANGNFAWVDPDVASSFANAERTLSWGLSAQQMLYAPLAISAYAAQKRNVESVSAGIDASRLDLVLDVGSAYLNYLRARTAERINRENLARIRKNLALAELRVDIGTSGPQDVARWEIELADGRANAIAASARRNQAEIAVNRLLNRPLEEAFTAAEPTAPDAGVVVDPRVRRYVEDPASFKTFRTFMVQEAMRMSPELVQLNKAIAAQQELLTGYTRQLYLPNVFVNGGFTHTLDRSGEGSGPVPSGLGFPERDNFTWQLGAALQFRVFDDSRYGTIQQVERTIHQLEVQRSSIAQRIEQGTRSALHATGSSAAAVGLRQDAARAALTNLDAVTALYQQGVVSIITLIDAQNQALLTRLAAADAVYQFLTDYLSAERASGAFGILRSDDDQNDFVHRLDEFAAAAKAENGEDK